MRSFVVQKFMLDDIGALQWKLAPPLEGEAEKDEVDIKEMLAEIESYAQRIEDLAIEVNIRQNFVFMSLCSLVQWRAARKMSSEKIAEKCNALILRCMRSHTNKRVLRLCFFCYLSNFANSSLTRERLTRRLQRS